MQAFSYHGLVLACFIVFAAAEGANAKTGGSAAKLPVMTPEQLAAKAAAESRNREYGTNIHITLGAVGVVFGFYYLVVASVRYIRTLTCINNNTQRYFKLPPQKYALIKKHLIYAPLFRSRHNREFRMFSMNLGVLPTRVQTLLMIGILAMNVTYCLYEIPWQGPRATLLERLRNRTGVLAVMNMVPLVLISGRNNPLIVALNLSFDNFNRFHRFLGRLVAAEAVLHACVQLTKMVEAMGWEAVLKAIRESRLITTGFMSVVTVVAIVLQTNSLVRRSCYEFFLHVHIALIILLIAALRTHLHGIPHQKYLTVVIASWAATRFVRLCCVLYRNVGRGGTKAVCERLPGDSIRVSIRVARPWRHRPGQYVFITIPSVGLWTSHPFSVAWHDVNTSPIDSEKGVKVDPNDLSPLFGSTVSFVIRRRSGFTSALHDKVFQAEGKFSVNAFIEGPYGGLQDLSSYGTVLLFAGGVGITHQLPFVRELVTGFADGTVAVRRVLLVWVIQSPEHLEWIQPWMTTILALDKRRDILRIQLFITRPRSTKETRSPSATVQMFPGKPNVDTIVQMECENQIGAMGVSVCGPGTLSDDVREAVRKRQEWRNIDYLEESYSW